MTTKKKKGFIASIIASVLSLVGCSSNTVVDEVRTPPKELPIATITFKDFGTVEVELYPHIAPNTVNNFIELSNNGFYDGLTFHRIIKDFMIQGGDPEGSGMGGPGYKIKGEFTSNKFTNNLSHTEGVISMARSQSKNSGGSQFFIVTKDAPHLDGQYASFGKVINGMDIVHEIENVETGANDRPVKDVIIESIKVDTKDINYDSPVKI
ncbi:peptidylprolyl isomerase [Romboutsia sp. 1001713B170207_170306_H8]|uniref:peptidylprolyl isomerase n=1 Tax=Romboutsia sp. 1001713B170207_170306_H8 TaxID=2787112 RepID=UPI000820C22C|nr:peptidylprolyl isomerase [Romboutsia sp. 1001713B170207_170306_H8]SCH53833.1 Putative peptidyl-prolyl cis-trans isomerase [uncultured Clostridium sp.]